MLFPPPFSSNPKQLSLSPYNDNITSKLSQTATQSTHYPTMKLITLLSLLGAVNSFTLAPPSTMSRAFVHTKRTTIKMSNIDEEIDVDSMTLEEEVREEGGC